MFNDWIEGSNGADLRPSRWYGHAGMAFAFPVEVLTRKCTRSTWDVYLFHCLKVSRFEFAEDCSRKAETQMSLFRRSALLILLILSTIFAGCGGFKGVVTPTLSSISPASVAAGSAGFTLTATGTNYISGTQIMWNGVAQSTKVVSNTQLTAAVSTAQIATAGTVSIRVIKPDTTTSNTMQLTITGSGSQTFSLTSISPSSVTAGAAAFTLTATGLGFINGDVITLNNTGVATTFVSASQLQTTVPASSVANPGAVAIGVLAPGNISSNQLPLTVTGTSAGAPPTLTSLSPSSAYNGSAAITLTANGAGFVNGSQIIWNGTALPTAFVSSTVVTASVAATSLATVVPVNVFVLNPDSTVSGFLPFTIMVSPTTIPILTSINPQHAAVGSPAFTLTLTGSDFAAGAVAYFGPDPLATTVVSNTQLTAQVAASELTKILRVPVTVQNSQSSASNPLPFWVGITVYYGEVNDLVWDTARNILYISSPATSSLHPNTVLAIDPNSLTVKYSYSPAAGSKPDRLAISDDGKYLYVGLDGDGTVERLDLPSLTPDLSIPLGSDPNLGPYYAIDVQVAPGQSTTIAVARGIPTSVSIVQAQGGIAVYDGTVRRPSIVTPTTQSGDVLLDTIQWGANATALYAADNENASGDFYQLAVSSNGVTLVSDKPNYFPVPNFRIHYDEGSKLLYGDDGLAVNPTATTQVGNFISTGIMVSDSTIGDAYFVGQPTADSGTVTYLVQSFNLAAYTAVARFQLSQVEGLPQHLIRWGATGLAFNTQKITNCIVSPCTTGDGRLYILNGPFVTQTVP
jgi:hypothetical protein